MQIIDISKEELTFEPLIESHNEVLKYCETIEGLYNVRITLEHNRAVEYTINIIDIESNKIVSIQRKAMPGKLKNYLKGLIDAHKLHLK